MGIENGASEKGARACGRSLGQPVEVAGSAGDVLVEEEDGLGAPLERPLRADYGFNLNLSSELQLRGLTRRHLFITIGPPF